MKHILIFLLLFICSTLSTAQTPQFDWVRTFGSTSNDFCNTVVMDRAGDMIYGGNFGDEIDFDPGPGEYKLKSAGHFDAFALKLDADGNFKWAIRLGNSSADAVRTIALDQFDNVYLLGGFSGTVDFDPGPGEFLLSTNYDLGNAGYILKLDKDGNFLWATKIDGAAFHEFAINKAGEILIGGSFILTVDFDSGPGKNELTAQHIDREWDPDLFILKLNPAGKFLWVKQIGGPRREQINAFKLDVAGDIVLTGRFSDLADLNPGPESDLYQSESYSDVFIMKLDNDGKLIWVKTLTNGQEIRSEDLSVDEERNIFLGGNFYGEGDFDPGPGKATLIPGAGKGYLYLLKLRSDGSFVFVKQFGTDGADRLFGITNDQAGSVYCTGSFEKTGDFDPGAGTHNLISKGYGDVYVAKLNSSGEFVWAYSLGSQNNYDWGVDVFVDPSNNVYTLGFFWGTVDFDPGPAVHNETMVGTGDMFMHKMNQCGYVTYATENITACNSYTVDGVTYKISGRYRRSLINSKMCDSIITMNIVIKGSVTDYADTVCESYLWQGKELTTSGNYTVTYKDTGGCDSILNLKLVVHKKSIVTIEETICEGQSVSGYSLEGKYVDTFTSRNGCDSVRTLILKVRPRIRTIVNATICEGGSYEGYLNAGNFTDTFSSVIGCDSIRTINLKVNPIKRSSLKIDICEGSFHFAGGAEQKEAGIYYDTLLAHTGCDSVIITSLNVHAKPRPILGENRNLCAGTDMTFAPGIYSQYQWQDNSSQPTFTTNRIGRYWVTVSDQMGCTGSDTVDITGISPSPSNFLKNTDSICQYQKLTLVPLSGFVSYQWSTGSTDAALVISAPGYYSLKVQNMQGCFGTDTIRVYQKECFTGVYIPNAFTPNNDSRNDVFRATVAGKLNRFGLKIFDRWGTLIFQSDDPLKAWNGEFRNKPCPSSNYIWQCIYQLEGANIIHRNGTVMLIR